MEELGCRALWLARVLFFFLCVLFACEGRGAGLVVDGMLVS